MIKINFKNPQQLICRIDEGYSEEGYFMFALSNNKVKYTKDAMRNDGIILSEYFAVISLSNIKSIEHVKPTEI